MIAKSLLDKMPIIKQRVKEIAEEALKRGIINEGEFGEIVNEFEREKIKIGIIGQIKYGKSTLLNALIFGKQILPAATTPMTASLSYITYGEKPRMEVEFFSQEDWEKIKELSKSKEEADTLEAKAAKEIIEKAKSISEEELNSLLGTKKQVEFAEVKDYVGEGGKYVPITKALTIIYPHERLKEASFVDTPGFNDPVSSREQRALEFLSEADVVIVLLYACRPFDKTDKELIFNKIETMGAGKLILVMNKKDTVIGEQGTEKKALQYIEEKYKEEIKEMKKKSGTSIIAEIFEKAPIVELSSLWALLGKMDEDSIKNDEDLSYHYKRFLKDFPFIKSQQDFLNYSGLGKLEEEIDKILKKEKLQIIVKKPILRLIGKYKEEKNKIVEEFCNLNVEEMSLNRSLEQIQEEKRKLGELVSFLRREISENTAELAE